MAARKRWVIPVVFFALVGVAGGVTAALWPEPEPDEPEVADDTGLDRDQTEEFMRTIGYVQ